MADEPGTDELDRALETAVQRTADAQSHVGEVIDAGLIPPVPIVDDVVQRAEDVRDLAESLDSSAASAEDGATQGTRMPTVGVRQADPTPKRT